MKVSELLNDIVAKLDTNASETDMIEWINALEKHMYRHNFMEAVIDTIDVVGLQAEYSLVDEPYSFEDIEVLKVDNVEHDKRIAFTDDAHDTFCKTSTGFRLYPVPLTDKENGIEVRHKKIPTKKTTLNKATEELTIVADFGEEYINLYRYYCYRHASISNREFTDANMYAVLYNETEDEFWNWYVSRLPNDTATRRKRRWR